MPQFFNPGWYRFLDEQFSTRPLDDVPERDEIRHRLLELDELIQLVPRSPLRLHDLHRHWRPENRTNLIELSPYNGYRVSEIYFRYGKSEQQIRSFGEVAEGSLPHVHISFGLTNRSFFYTIVFNQTAWLDYQNMLDILRRNGDAARVLMEGVRELGRAGYRLWGPAINNSLSTFATADALLRALPLPNERRDPQDKVGMSRDWNPEDPEIDEATIVQTSTNEISRLWPIFNSVALRHPP
jgi:hypothetical protein